MSPPINSNLLSDYWKVPYRQVYCDTFWGWVKAAWHCHIALRLNPPNFPPIAPGPKPVPRGYDGEVG